MRTNVKRKADDHPGAGATRDQSFLVGAEVMSDSVMRVRVRKLRKSGRVLNRDELKDIPPLVGVLRVAEVRDHELGRPIVCARLLDPTTKVDVDLTPELGDARLLWVEGRKMRLTGIERLQDADVAQTWSVELD
jgi:hypothetical protein